VASGYPKIWTTILHEDWFVSLSCTQRGIYLQLLLMCKDRGDNGTFSSRSYAALASDLGTDRRTLAYVLDIFVAMSRLSYTHGDKKTIVVHIPNYLKWQGIEQKTVRSYAHNTINQASKQASKQDESESPSHEGGEGKEVW